MLRFEKLRKIYTGVTIVSVDELTIKNGIVLLQGENGSGKTTLLKMIAGLLPFEGDIIVNNSFSIKKQRRQFIQLINYAETEPLYPEFLTASELVKLYCYAKNGSITNTEAILQQLHIFDVYKKPVSTYSSGMIKKLSIALAMTGNPQWILLDEPLITTDVQAVETICNIIKEKHAAGISFLLTSHQHFAAGQLFFTSTMLAQDHTITITK